MGLLRPTAGRSRVAGLDAWSQRDRVHALTGYLPGDFAGYSDVTGEDYLRYLLSLRRLRGWERVGQLARRLDADLGRRIGGLSHGNRQKIGIIQALMHDPPVLILDEPTTGLDPLVQREFLQVIRERRDEGCTVFFSSHVLSEVEAVADRVAILRTGTLVAQLDVADVRSTATRRLDVVFDRPPDADFIRAIPGVLDVAMSDGTAHIVASGTLAELFRGIAPFGLHNVVTHEADLEDVFLSYYGRTV
jgi:ABC-2 type transport system ATP-binding protein